MTAIGNPSRESGGLEGPTEVTLKDIARLAGVSMSTVSRAIHRPEIVAGPKLEAVRKVLERFSYIPNNAARILSRGRSMTVGMIVPTLANPLFAPTIEAAEETLRAAGYGVLVACSNRNADREFEQVKTMLERGVDGLILTGSIHREEMFPLLEAKGVDAVFQDCPDVFNNCVSVAMQDAAAMELVVDTLVERGHRRIAVLTGPTQNTPAVAERVRGARERLQALGMTVGDADVAETADYDAATAKFAMQALLARQPRYTAIACTGDILALGAIMAIREAGLSVPDDISIIGCSDSVMAQFVDPPLTTVHMPFRRMGEIASERLLDRLNGVRTSQLHTLDFHLEDRRSVRAL